MNSRPEPLWESWQQWESLELLVTEQQLDLLFDELTLSGVARTVHMNLAEQAFVVAAWRFGPSDYVALQSRSDFFRAEPDARERASRLEATGQRVEYASVTLDEQLESRPGSGATRRRLVSLACALRERCGLGKGYLVQLDPTLFAKLEHLALHDRHASLWSRMEGAGGPGHVAPDRREAVELAAWDRLFDGRRQWPST